MNKQTIRNKIYSIEKTKKIVKAMEMIAISKMRKINKIVLRSASYKEMVSKIIKHIGLRKFQFQHSYLIERNIKRVVFLVVSTDCGLVGSLNIILFKTVIFEIQQCNNKNIDFSLILIGSKAISFFNYLSDKVIYQINKLDNDLIITTIMDLLQVILPIYDTKNIDKVFIIYNMFINMLSQKPQVLQILPVLFPECAIADGIINDYIYESDDEILLNTIFRRYIESQIYQSIMHNLLSEQAARMMAMKIASDNSTNLIDSMKTVYHKSRQNSITKELSEIISGVFLN